jgi:hypothetical protein
MPQNITESITYPTTIQSVADGDAGSGANFLLAPQGLTNRTAYFKNVLENAGVTLIRSGTVAAMQAINNAANGSVFLVTDLSAKYQGLYICNALSSLTPDNSLVYAATGMGSGNWIHECYSLLNANLGLAAIGPIAGSSGIAANRLKASLVPNGIVYTGSASGWSAATVTATSLTDIAGASLTIPSLQVGDIVDVRASGSAYATASGGHIAIQVNDGGALYGGYPTGCAPTVGSTHAPWAANCLRTLQTAGSVTVKLQAQVTSGTIYVASSSAQGGGGYLVAMVIRP